MKDKQKTKTILKALALVVIVVIIPLVIYLTNREFFASFKSIEDVEVFISNYGKESAIVYLILQILQVVISVIPGEVFQVAAGYLFGPLLGIILAVVGSFIGEAIAFGLARFLGRGFVHLFMSKEQFEVYHERLNSNKAYTLCFILYQISFLPFLLISTVARLPGLIGSIAMGTLIDRGSYHIALIILAAACVICVLGFIYRNKLSDFMDKLKEKRDDKQ